jgi:hypothetical protein
MFIKSQLIFLKSGDGKLLLMEFIFLILMI